MALTAVPLLLTVVLQLPPSDRSHAEELARAGRSTDAIKLFKEIVNRDPADVEARLWIAPLDLVQTPHLNRWR